MSGVESFGQRLRRAVEERGRVIAGVDPHASLLEAWSLPDTPEGLREFSRTALAAVGGSVAALKFAGDREERVEPLAGDAEDLQDLQDRKSVV